MHLKAETGTILHRTAQRILGGGETVNLLNIAIRHYLIVYEAQGKCMGLVIGYPVAIRKHLTIGFPVRIEDAFLATEYFDIWTPPQNNLPYPCESAQIDIGLVAVAGGSIDFAQMKNEAAVRASRHFLKQPAEPLDLQNIRCAMCACWHLLLERGRG